MQVAGQQIEEEIGLKKEIGLEKEIDIDQERVTDTDLKKVMDVDQENVKEQGPEKGTGKDQGRVKETGTETNMRLGGMIVREATTVCTREAIVHEVMKDMIDHQAEGHRAESH